ncbi:MAG: bifunctional precorrin-2 dehydrogenase/sirohydrochlorin ferrochelatase [Candidatus Omnitrophica bacterium]|nr:bifunctional precorrin-2 dehydrogenase/sirohydrochlorin ferrochelatase [Candidatus Omnitrophota bacterium]MBU1923037.1 bifunctional precorrin-2 dehydrogenase/sirohydrochlorin ferrochelatase [Candidatus Omnitrophota bacterium]
MGYYPIAVKVEGASALVIGGGKIAQRKARVLLKAGAKVTLISPKVTNVLGVLAKRTKLKWIKRKVNKNDIAKARIVIAATNDALVNKNVSSWSKKQGVLVNIVDNSSLSSFISPAVFKKSNLIVAVNSNGRDAQLSRDLKNYIKEQWGEFLSYRRRLQKRAS